MSLLRKINERLKQDACNHDHVPVGTRLHYSDEDIPIYDEQELMQCACGHQFWRNISPERLKSKWVTPMKAKSGHVYVIGKRADTGELHPTRVTLAEAKACAGDIYPSYKDCLKATEQYERI